MQSHLDEILILVSELRASGAKLLDMDIIVYILMSLPDNYNAVKAAIENQPNENLTLEFVTKRLIDSDQLMQENKGKFNSRARRIDVSYENENCANKSLPFKKEVICYSCNVSCERIFRQRL